MSTKDCEITGTFAPQSSIALILNSWEPSQLSFRSINGNLPQQVAVEVYRFSSNVLLGPSAAERMAEQVFPFSSVSLVSNTGELQPERHPFQIGTCVYS